jgi:hypothetical protein
MADRSFAHPFSDSYAKTVSLPAAPESLAVRINRRTASLPILRLDPAVCL